jgi:hypothetical protein
MPPLPDVPGVAKVHIRGVNQGQAWQNTIHIGGIEPGITSGSLSQIADAVGDAWSAHFAPLFGTLVSVSTIEAIDLTSRTGNTGSDATTRVGTNLSATYVSVQTSICVSQKVAYRWRGGHPRFYLPSPPSSSIQDGHRLTTSAQTAAQNAADAFLAAINLIAIGGSGKHLTTVRYWSQKVLLSNPLVLPVIDMVVHGRLDSQRRRLGQEVT